MSLFGGVALAEVISSGQLNNPYKVTSAQGYLYSVDTSNNQIKKFDSSGKLLYSFGAYGSSNNQFNQPQGIAADSKGYVYVVDTGNQRIQKFYDDGNSFSFLESISNIPELSDPNLSFPRSIRVNDKGEIFIVDTEKNRVIKYSTKVVIGGKIAGVLAQGAGEAAGIFNSPYGADIDDSGSIYVSDTKNHRIKKYSTSGKLLLEFGSRGEKSGQFLYPFDIKVDSGGSIYVADTGNNRIQKFDRFGKYLDSIGGSFFAPRGIFISKEGYLYIVGADNKIQKIDTAVHVTDLLVTEYYISPNLDNIKDQTGIVFTLSEPALIDLDIYDSSGMTLLDKFVVSKKLVKGVNQIIWKGLDSSGKKFSDGKYTIKISGHSPDGKKEVIPVNGKVIVDTIAPSVGFDPNLSLFSPNGDGIKDYLSVNYSVSDNYSISIKLEESILENKRILRILSKKEIINVTASASAVSSLSWDGRIGNFIIEGEYFVQLKATDIAGNTSYNIKKAIVDLQPPHIESPLLSAKYFSPNGDGKKDSTDISFYLNDSLSALFNISLRIMDQKNSEIVAIKDNKLVGRGQQSVEWEGKAFDQIVADDVYKIEIIAEDEAGNQTKDSSLMVTVDTIPPKVIALDTSPNPFTPNNDGTKDTTTFYYKLSENANNTLKIYRKDDNSLFKQHIFYNSASDSWQWDGRGAQAELINEEFDYCLIAEDNAGNTGSSETKNVVVDIVPSLVPYAYALPDPFSTVNSSGNFTNINYYLSRNNTRVQITVLGHEGKPLKNLVFGETQNKGKHSVKWHGDFITGYSGPRATKDPTKVADGSYVFTVLAQDSDGGPPTEVTNTVLVDNVPPYIFCFPVRVNYEKNEAALKYSIPESSSVEVAMYDLDDHLIKEVYTGPTKAGTYSLNYKPQSLDEKGYFKIIAVDNALNKDEKETEVVSFKWVENLTVANHSANPSTFTPNGDGHTDNTRISYTLSGGIDDYRVTLEILNSTGSTIKTIVDDQVQSGGPHSYYWSGERDQGVPPVTDGEYKYEISVGDKLSNKTTAKGDILAVVSRPTVTISSDFDIFSPNGDGSQDNALFTYSINYPAQWITGESDVRIDIKSATGEVVFTKSLKHSAGTYNYAWDGKINTGSSAGAYAKAGTYYAYISATDALGSPAIPQNKILTINYDTPQLSVLSISNNPFSPNVNSRKDTVSVSYSLAEDAYVTVDVKDTAGKLVKNLQSDKWSQKNMVEPGLLVSGPTPIQAKAIPAITWDGKDTSGSIVSDGNYKIVLSSKDKAGNTASVSAAIQVDNTLPQVPSVIPLPSYTNEAILNYKGTGEANCAIEIYKDGILSGTASTDAFGDFKLPVTLALGKNNLKSRAIDPAGNVTGYSANQTINYETTSPAVLGLKVTPTLASALPVTISFTASETLEADPVVTVNGKSCKKIGSTANLHKWEYIYSYTVISSDQQGKAAIKITISDLASNKSSYSNSTALSIDTVFPILSNFEVKPPNANLGTKVKFDFSVSEELLQNPTVEAGTSLADYDSKTVYSNSLIDYKYAYTITSSDANRVLPIKLAITDLAGNTSSKQYALENGNPVLTVDQVYPKLSILPVTNNPFSPNINNRRDSASIIYDLSEDAFVTAEIKDLGGKLINKLVNNKWRSAFGSGSITRTIVWDGKDSKGTIVKDGDYGIKISARDKAQNETTASASLEVDNTLPQVPSVVTFAAYTNEAVLNYKGTGEAGSAIEIYKDGALNGTASADAFGNFTLPVTLTLGDNYLKSRAIDPAGNVTDYCSAQKVVYETTPPTVSNLEVSPPLAKALTVVMSFEVSETLEADPAVTVNDKLAKRSGSRKYEYTYDVSSLDKQGKATIGISVSDLAANKNSLTNSKLLSIDTEKPSFSNFDVDPEYAKLGKDISIDFSVSEKLLQNPAVEVGSKPASFESKTEILDSRIDYNYKYTVATSDTDGITPVKITVHDLAGNENSKQYSDLTIDKVKPGLKTITVAPNPAKKGGIAINFTVSETLNKTPIVKVTQAGGSAIVAQTSNISGNEYRSLYDVYSGKDGAAVINFELADLALNQNTPSATFEVDTKNPAFSNVKSEIKNNLSFNKYAKENGTAIITFKTSESLKYNPGVKVNGNPASYQSLLGDQYAYAYTVKSTDTNGTAEVSVSGYDLAMNEGEYTTSGSSETFIIDLINPTVSVPSNPDLISQPSPFTINGTSEAQDRRTTLQYKTSEYGNVVVRIHKIPDTQTSYSKSDFTSSNLIRTYNEGYLDSDTHLCVWDGRKDNNNYADPGKYAFIVEVKDPAGNITQKMWGGTVWIQDNVLDAIEPQNLTPGDTNPQPKYFSPGGNSTANKSTKFWFRINLTVVPSAPARPEPISAMAAGDVKEIGVYTVRVYDKNKALIRTIVGDAKAYSTTDVPIIWDGKNDAGSAVADGDYLIEVDVRDFLNQSARTNNFSKYVAVDNTSPAITDNQTGDDTWRKEKGTEYNVDFSDTSSKLYSADYKVGSEWISIFSGLSAESFAANWTVDFDKCAEGKNYISVQAKDGAGNTAQTNDIFYVMKDTTNPAGGVSPIQIDGDNAYTKNLAVALTLSANDPNGINGSGVDKVKIWNDAASEPPDSSAVVYETPKSWSIENEEGVRTVNVKFGDKAGNFSAKYSDTIVYDKTPPKIINVSASPDPFSPGNADGRKDSITFSFTTDETALVKIFVDGSEIHKESYSSGNHSRIWSPGTGISEGSHTYSIYAEDNTANSITWTGGSFIVDNTAPVISGISVSPYIFTPDGDGVHDATTISYSVSEPSTVTITIKDKNGTAVKTLTGGDTSCTWDGSGTTNKKRGRYTYYVDAKDSAGNSAVQQSGKVVIKAKDEVVVYDQNGSGSDEAVLFYPEKASKYNDRYDHWGLHNSDGSYLYKEIRRVRTGDFNNDGIDEIVILDHEGTPPNVIRIYDPNTHAEKSFSIGGNDNGYDYMAVGDFNGDGIAEIAVTKLDGSVLIYNYNGTQLASGNLGYDCHRIGSGDFDGDEKDEIAVIYGKDPNARIKLFNYEDLNNAYKELSFGPTYEEARDVNGGDINGDGTDEVIVLDHNGTAPDYLHVYSLSDGSHKVLTGLTRRIDYWSDTLDYNGDGRDELIFSENGGDTYTSIYDLATGSLIREWSMGGECKQASAGNFSGTVKASVSHSPVIQQSTKPELISPTDGSTVTSLRPEFKWKGVRGVENYRINLGKTTLLSIPDKAINKTVTQSEASPSDGTIPSFAASIHEFDEGLDRGPWQWQVAANPGATNEAKSETWSFTIDPPLTISGITNYPNPFNPNNERTKIRYRLGAEADDVIIRIYDLTGSLVRELDGTTNAETSSIWGKYNDVDWDGRNDMGDLVLNGIYPFEIVAKLGGTSVSGRGKIAVLK